ncbi:MAG: ATP-binding cassette domain-containing protein [Chitinophagales bacterium]|nr:ATP-binding cassette domain-containing protein [Chitinophagales bacterium]
MIEIENVKKSFDGQEILKGISSVFEDGKCNLIIGKSGSGKTVLVKCIIGLFEPEAGHIFYDGRDLTEMNFKEKKKIRNEIGMLFQGNALFTSLSVEENVRFPLDMFTDQTLAEKKERVNFCLSRVNLEGVNDKYPSEISGGMMKRVGIARAIVLNPKYLFCDEPNSGLDPRTAIVIDQLIREITQEYQMTTIVNTHDMNSVMGIGDHVVYLHEGHNHWEGSNKEILNTKNKELYDFIFASDFLKKLKEQTD